MRGASCAASWKQPHTTQATARPGGADSADPFGMIARVSGLRHARRPLPEYQHRKGTFHSALGQSGHARRFWFTMVRYVTLVIRRAVGE